MKDTIKLGVNIPLFVIGTLVVGFGSLIGIIGIWGYFAKGTISPEWIKISHGHIAWWGVLVLIASVILPSLNVKSWFKSIVLIGTALAPLVWGVGFYLYYARDISAAMYLLPISEAVLLIILLAVALVASGFRLPFITTEEVTKGRFELITNIEIPRRIFIVPTIVAILGVLVGFYITSTFRVAHKPIEPAALVQFHTHTVILSASAVIMLLLLRILNVEDRVFNIAVRISQVALPLVFLGLLLFNIAKIHSLVWVIPAGIYYLLPIAVFLASIGLIKSKPVDIPYHPAMKTSIAFATLVLLVLIATGAYIALKWDTTPEVTVTFRQEAFPHVGPYYDPEKGYPGTAPARNTPRGLENAHYSPGSWLHVALMWLVGLTLLSASGAFTNILNKPGLLYLFAITIPLAPFFNALGRYLAWAPYLGPAALALQIEEPMFPGAPGGIGALWYAGHPLKAFNILALAILGIALIYIISKKTEKT